jgi:type IV pilus assembly protein PilV
MRNFPFRVALGRSQKGVALIECLIALLIFSFGVLGLVGLEARAINFSLDAEDRNRAAVFANEVASQMWLNGTVTPTTATYTNLLATISQTANGGLPSGAIAVTPVAGTTNATDIKITWTAVHDASTSFVSTYTTRVILP